MLGKIVKTYQSNSKIVDHIFIEQNKLDKSFFISEQVKN